MFFRGIMGDFARRVLGFAFGQSRRASIGALRFALQEALDRPFPSLFVSRHARTRKKHLSCSFDVFTLTIAGNYLVIVPPSTGWCSDLILVT